MHIIDWAVLTITLAAVVVYGLVKSRNLKKSEDFLAGKRDLKWITIGFSIMATQASAITFLSTPGQSFADGMQFLQFYFGMPIAMIILAYLILPIYYNLRITTAYEYLEQRFDLRMRTFTAVLFLFLRGISAAISIYAPGIILSAVLGWNLALTNFFLAAFVILYTTLGGNTAVSRTQELQMSIMLGGLILALGLIFLKLPHNVGLPEAWSIAEVTGKSTIVDWSFNWHDRYNIWSGLLGATFLFLSYFGTDQSQVGRYLSGKTLRESRTGLLFNGFIKIPMQFLILLVGIMVFVFYQFKQPPLYFNEATREKIRQTTQEATFTQLENKAASIHQEKQSALNDFVNALKTENTAQEATSRAKLQDLELQRTNIRKSALETAKIALPNADVRDKDFVFIDFVRHNMPIGLIGLMFAMIFCASWSTTASELNALAATTASDIYRRSIVKNRDDTHYMKASRYFTFGWGLFIMLFASFVALPENLIQAVNMIGSIFYGTMLGIFLTAFFLKNVGAKAVFWAAIAAQATVLYCYFAVDKDAYLWYNPLGCSIVMAVSQLLQWTLFRLRKT
jgi:SSS family transporter